MLLFTEISMKTFSKVVSKERPFSRKVDIFGDMGEKSSFAKLSEKLLFLDMLLYTALWLKNKIFPK